MILLILQRHSAELNVKTNKIMKKYLILSILVCFSLYSNAQNDLPSSGNNSTRISCLGTQKYLIEDSISDNSTLKYYCGSFSNQDHYSADKDGFIALVKTNKKSLLSSLRSMSGIPSSSDSNCKFLFIKGYKYNNQNMTDEVTNIIELKNKNLACATYSNYEGGLEYYESHIIVIDTLGNPKWDIKIPNDRNNRQYIEKMLTDNNGDIYALYAVNGKYELTSHGIIKVSGKDGSIIWNEGDVPHGDNADLFLYGGATIDNNYIYIVFNFRTLTFVDAKFLPNEPINSSSVDYTSPFNIVFIKYDLDGHLLQVKPLLSEEPKIINEVYMKNGQIEGRGRRGKVKCLQDLNLSEDMFNFNTPEFSTEDNENGSPAKNSPFLIDFDKNGGIIKTNGKFD
jgi:hypothetical protein